uniref:EHMT1/2 cysteine-rich region domain-containing protein n=1 Tax=Hucho hucho TaxID=62062 RepID=A0A4W5P9S6_9TELE
MESRGVSQESEAGKRHPNPPSVTPTGAKGKKALSAKSQVNKKAEAKMTSVQCSVTGSNGFIVHKKQARADPQRTGCSAHKLTKTPQTPADNGREAVAAGISDLQTHSSPSVDSPARTRCAWKTMGKPSSNPAVLKHLKGDGAESSMAGMWMENSMAPSHMKLPSSLKRKSIVSTKSHPERQPSCEGGKARKKRVDLTHREICEMQESHAQLAKQCVEKAKDLTKGNKMEKEDNSSKQEYTELSLESLNLKAQDELLSPPLSGFTVDGEVTETDLSEELPLCCCRMETPCSGESLFQTEHTCMATDRVDGLVSRCQRNVLKHEMMRPSNTVHLLVLCEDQGRHDQAPVLPCLWPLLQGGGPSWSADHMAASLTVSTVDVPQSSRPRAFVPTAGRMPPGPRNSLFPNLLLSPNLSLYFLLFQLFPLWPLFLLCPPGPSFTGLRRPLSLRGCWTPPPTTACRGSL